MKERKGYQVNVEVGQEILPLPVLLEIILETSTAKISSVVIMLA